jgi:serine/threonine-protein kinase
MSGGTPVPVCQTAVIFGAHWTVDDRIVFTSSTGILRVSAGGGTPEVLVKSEKGERFGSVQMLPGGRVVLFSASIGGTNWDDAEIAVRRLDTGERISILRGGSDARYLANGILIYGRGPDLMAVPFDPATLKMRGAPVPVVNGIAGAGVSLSGAYQYAVSDNGTLAYIAGAAVSDLELAWVDRSGRATVIASEAGAGYPRLSSDGTRVAFGAVDAGNADIFIRDRVRNTRTRLTFDPARDTSPIWTHDSKRIIYGSARDGAQSLYWQAADGTGTAERLTTAANDQYPYAVTPDGKTVIYIELNPVTSWISTRCRSWAIASRSRCW